MRRSLTAGAEGGRPHARLGVAIRHAGTSWDWSDPTIAAVSRRSLLAATAGLGG